MSNMVFEYISTIWLIKTITMFFDTCRLVILLIKITSFFFLKKEYCFLIFNMDMLAVCLDEKSWLWNRKIWCLGVQYASRIILNLYPIAIIFMVGYYWIPGRVSSAWQYTANRWTMCCLENSLPMQLKFPRDADKSPSRCKFYVQIGMKFMLCISGD